MYDLARYYIYMFVVVTSRYLYPKKFHYAIIENKRNNIFTCYI